MGEVPRLRMFAGPNGSGKSTLKSLLTKNQLGVFINADEIQLKINQNRKLPLKGYGVSANNNDWKAFLNNSSRVKTLELQKIYNALSIDNQVLFNNKTKTNAYQAALVADFLRVLLLAQKNSFTFETVMSHKSKVDLLAEARQLGYRTYLYYIATQDPEINVSRVRSRVKLGGHPVEKGKIISRYTNSLNLLHEAIKHSSRAFIFDNSLEGTSRTLIAEFDEGKYIPKLESVPAWFHQYVIQKI